MEPNTNPDFTVIPFTLGDRDLAKSTASEVKGMRDDVKDLKDLMTEHIKVVHAKIDTQLEDIRTDKKADDRVARRWAKIGKVVVGVMGLVGVLFGIVEAFTHIL